MTVFPGQAILDTDRKAFPGWLAALADTGALTVYAWPLLPNHAHLLVRIGTRPLPRSMRSLLTSHAGGFNHRHCRASHLFHYRYPSIVVGRTTSSGNSFATSISTRSGPALSPTLAVHSYW